MLAANSPTVPRAATARYPHDTVIPATVPATTRTGPQAPTPTSLSRSRPIPTPWRPSAAPPAALPAPRAGRKDDPDGQIVARVAGAVPVAGAWLPAGRGGGRRAGRAGGVPVMG